MRNSHSILRILGWVWITLILPFAWISIQVVEQLPRKGLPQNLYDTTLGFIFLPGWPIVLTCSVLGLLLLATIITFIWIISNKQDEAVKSTSTNNVFIFGPVQIIHGDQTNVTRNVNYFALNESTENIIMMRAQKESFPINGHKNAPFQIPHVSTQLIGRGPEISALKTQMLQRQTRMLGITGFGGIGKTILAARLAHDIDIIKAFPNGILWASVEGNADFREILVHWIHAINPSINIDRSELNEWELLEIFFQITRNHRMLLILDDVSANSIWYMETLVRYIGQYSKVLITSRLVNLPGVDNLVSLDVLPQQAALALMEKELERNFSKEEKIIAEEVAFLSGYLPLALKIIIGSMKSSNRSIGEIRDGLRAQIGYHTTIGLDEVRENTINRVFDKIYNNLSVTDQARFYTLAILPMPFNLEAAAAVWCVTASEAAHTIAQFTQNSLLTSSNGCYGMHPLLSEFANRLLQNADQEEQRKAQKAYKEYFEKKSEIVD